MVKKKYVAQIQPKIDKADEQNLNRQFRGILGGFKINMNSMAKLGVAVGGASVIMAIWNHQKKSIDAVNSSFDEYLANADRLSTIANDLQANAGSFALADVGLSTYGLKQEDRDKLYASIKSAMAEGKIVNKGGNLLGSLADIQNEYKNALASGDIAKQSQLRDLTGLRGQKATEFLSGNLQEQIAMQSKKFNQSDINTAINKGAELEQKQAEALATQQLKGLIQISKVANEGIIKSQAQYNEALKQATIEQYGNYDNMIKLEIAKQKTINEMWKLLDGVINPIIKKASNASGDAVSIIASIIGAIMGQLFTGFKSKIVSYINDILARTPFAKYFGITPLKPTESEKNNKNTSFKGLWGNK